MVKHKITIELTVNDQQLKDLTEHAHRKDLDVGTYMSSIISDNICDYVTWETELDDYEIEVTTKELV